MNPWIEHIKAYAKKKNISYSKALKDPQAKAMYHNSRGGMVNDPQLRDDDDEPENIDSPTTRAYREIIKTAEAGIEKRALAKRMNMMVDSLYADIDKLVKARFYITEHQGWRLKREIDQIIGDEDISFADIVKELERIEKLIEPFLISLSQKQLSLSRPK